MSFRLVFVLTFLIASLSGISAQTQPVPTPRPSSTATPSPTASPAPSATPPPQQTVFDLQARLRQSLQRPEVRRGMVGVKVISMSTGKVVFEENAEKYFMPASNMKNFTVAAALDRLGPAHRIATSIFALAPPDAEGTVTGDLRIFGRGDVSMSDRFNGGDANNSLNALVEKIASLGIRRITGDIVGDDGYFRGFPIPASWEWDDLQWSYGAEVSALPLNDSVVDVSVRPGTAGQQCNVQIKPYTVVIRIANTCNTGVAGEHRTLRVHKRLDQNLLEISGSMPANDRGWDGTVTVSRPAEFFAAMLRQKLLERGITVGGNHRHERRADGSLPVGVELGRVESAPMSVIAAQTMKPSQNMYTETLLWTLGELERNANPAPGGGTTPVSTAESAELGISAVKKFLTGIGVAPDGVVQYDGSGLSRHNLITPAAVVQLYNYMGKSRYAQAWRDSLTVGGVDGTLRNRFKGTRAQGNVRGKTGTIDQVSALSGYVRTAAGEELAFSMVVNGVPETSTRTSLIDEMTLALANFNGRIE